MGRRDQGLDKSQRQEGALGQPRCQPQPLGTCPLPGPASPQPRWPQGGRGALLPHELVFRPWGRALISVSVNLGHILISLIVKKTKTKQTKNPTQPNPKQPTPLPTSSCSELCTWLVKMMTEASCLLCFLAHGLGPALPGGVELRGRRRPRAGRAEGLGSTKPPRQG